MYPFERFSEEARRVLVAAQHEAERPPRSYIGTEHLLLALVEVDSVAGQLLQELGVEREAVEQAVDDLLRRTERVEVEQVVPTARLKRVIDLAMEAARREGRELVGSDDVLVGLMEEAEGVAAHVLRHLGVTAERVQELRGSVAAPVPDWPQAGARVLLHDPEPPFRLWEGTVVARTGELATVEVLYHPERTLAEIPVAELHAIILEGATECPRCRFDPEEPP